MLAAVPVLLIATSVIEAIWLATSLRLAPVIGLLIGTGVILLLPAIRILGEAGWIMRARTAAAPVVDTPLPNVRLVEGSPVSDGRVRLSVDSGIGAEVTTILMPVDGPRLLAVNGRELPPGGWRLIEHWGVPDGSLDLEIGVADSQVMLSFTVAEHLFRPEEILGHDVFERPPKLAPNIRANSDIAMIKTPVTVNLLSGTVEVGHAATSLEASLRR